MLTERVRGLVVKLTYGDCNLEETIARKEKAFTYWARTNHESPSRNASMHAQHALETIFDLKRIQRQKK